MTVRRPVRIIASIAQKIAFKDQTLILGFFQKLIENGFLHTYFDLAPVFEWD